MFFWLNTLKAITKAPVVHLLRMNTLRGTKPAFLTPKGYDEHPPVLVICVSPLGVLCKSVLLCCYCNTFFQWRYCCIDHVIVRNGNIETLPLLIQSPAYFP